MKESDYVLVRQVAALDAANAMLGEMLLSLLPQDQLETLKKCRKEIGDIRVRLESKIKIK